MRARAAGVLAGILLSLLLFPFRTLGKDPARSAVVFLGDSLTAGYGLDEEAAYPARLQDFFDRDGIPWTAVNAGVSGDTTAGGLKRMDWVLRSTPSVVVIALGANDGLRGLDPAHTKENLASIVRKVRGSGARAVLCGMKLPANYGRPHRERFEAVYRGVSRDLGVPLYPFLLEGAAMDPALTLADGIHPNEAGQRLVAEKLYRFLLPILATSGRK